MELYCPRECLGDTERCTSVEQRCTSVTWPLDFDHSVTTWKFDTNLQVQVFVDRSTNIIHQISI